MIGKNNKTSFDPNNPGEANAPLKLELFNEMENLKTLSTKENLEKKFGYFGNYSIYNLKLEHNENLWSKGNYMFYNIGNKLLLIPIETQEGTEMKQSFFLENLNIVKQVSYLGHISNQYFGFYVTRVLPQQFKDIKKSLKRFFVR